MSTSDEPTSPGAGIPIGPESVDEHGAPLRHPHQQQVSNPQSHNPQSVNPQQMRQPGVPQGAPQGGQYVNAQQPLPGRQNPGAGQYQDPRYAQQPGRQPAPQPTNFQRAQQPQQPLPAQPRNVGQDQYRYAEPGKTAAQTTQPQVQPQARPPQPAPTAYQGQPHQGQPDKTDPRFQQDQRANAIRQVGRQQQAQFQSDYFSEKGVQSGALEHQREQMFGAFNTEDQQDRGVPKSFAPASQPISNIPSDAMGTEPDDLTADAFPVGRDYNAPLSPVQDRDPSPFSDPNVDNSQYSTGFGSPFRGDEDANAVYADGQQDADFYETEYDDAEYDDQPQSRRGLLVVGVLVGALGLGGALAYAYRTGGFIGEVPPFGDPKVIKADNGPLKESPKIAGGEKKVGQRKQFYERLDGTKLASATPQERVLSRQEPVLDNTNLGKIAENIIGSKPDAGTTKQVAVNTPAVPGALPTGTVAKPGGPIKVKTLKVLPDGRIMNAPAPAAKKTLEIPTLKSTSVSEVKSQVVANTRQIAKPITPQQAQPSVKIAEVTPAATRQTAPVAAKPATGPGFIVQVASRQDQARALEALADLKLRYAKVLGSHKPLIKQADLGAKGVWWRIQIGPMKQRADAKSMCTKLKAAGHKSCWVQSTN